MPKTDLTDSGVGAIHYGQIYTYYSVSTTSTLSFVAPETAERLAKVQPGDIIITNTSENVQDVGKAVAWLGGEPIVTGGHATVIKHSEDPKYLSYWFRTDAFLKQKRALARGTKVIDVSAKQLATITVPLPPLGVQREIARFLDHFTELNVELERDLDKELLARRQQYAYFHDALLSFTTAKDVPWRQLGEIGEVFRGRRFVKSDYVEEGIGAIHYGQLYTHFNTKAVDVITRVREDLRPTLRYVKPGDVVIAEVGETVEDVGKAVAWLGEEDVAIHDGCFGLRHDMDPVFIAYCLQTPAFHKEKNRHVARAKMKRLSLEGLRQIRIPVPPREVQEEIVRTLELFQSVEEQLEAELRSEIPGRRQQYEHYCNRLLAFKELE
jgi:type I restriction enzyme S subunit